MSMWPRQGSVNEGKWLNVGYPQGWKPDDGFAFCDDCGGFFPLSKDSSPYPGLHACPPCKQRSDDEREKIRQAAEEEKNREDRDLLRKEAEALSVAKKNPLAKYGITPADYQAMYDASGGRCPACKESCAPIKFLRASGEDPQRRVLCVDHDHDAEEKLPVSEKWKAVRGLLCGSCNAALGLLRDDPEAIDGLLNYAKFHRSGGKNRVLHERKTRGEAK